MCHNIVDNGGSIAVGRPPPRDETDNQTQGHAKRNGRLAVEAKT